MDAFSAAVLFAFATGRLNLSFGCGELIDAGEALLLLKLGAD
jgi:hypothetical protein